MQQDHRHDLRDDADVCFQELSATEIRRCTVATRVKNKDGAKIFFMEVAIVQLRRMSCSAYFQPGRLLYVRELCPQP
jgi:hypothetical protein